MSSETFDTERQAVLDAVQRIVAMGLVSGASGNVSCRIRRDEGDLFAVTASRVPYHRLSADDVLIVDAEVDPLWGDGVPSSESLVHMAVYHARPDVGAVIHTHSPYASAFAAAGREIPPILDEQVVSLGGAVNAAEYGAAASQELADRAVEALAHRAAVLLRNHGAVGVGTDLEEAIAVVELLEHVARVATLSQALGGPRGLPAHVVKQEQAMYRMMKGFRED